MNGLTKQTDSWNLPDACWLLLSAGLLAMVLFCGVNLPYMDEWPMVTALASSKPPWPWIFDWHNEHLLPIPRFIFWALFQINHDLRTAMVLSVLLWCALARLLMHAARSARGHAAFSDALFPLLLLHPGQFENVLMSYQIGFALSAFLAGCLFMLMTGGPATTRRVGAVGVCVILLPGCGGHGLLFALPGLIWLTLIAIFNSGRRMRTFAILGLLLGTVTSSCYLWLPGKLTPSADVSLGIGRWIAGLFGFAAGGFGPVGERFWPWTVAMPAAVWIAFVWTVKITRHEAISARWTQYLGGLLAFGGVTVLAAAVAWGRARHGLHTVFFPRYAGFAALLPATAMLFLLRFAPPRLANHATTYLAVITLLAFPFNVLSGWRSADRLANIQRCALRDLTCEVPVEVIARQYHFLIYNDPVAIIRFLQEYANSGIGPVNAIRHEPPSRAISLPPPTGYSVREQDGAWITTGPVASLKFDLGSPRIAYAVVIRGQYRYPAAWPPALASVMISRQPEHTENWIVPVFRLPTPQLGDPAIIIWLDGPVSSVTVSPDEGAWGFRITSAELLVPPE